MFEKVKGKIGEIKEENQRRREERIRIAREKAEEEARIERERIKAEKEALMALSEKELMVEAILALRGYNTRIATIEEQQDELAYRVDSLKADVSSLESTVSGLSND
jgi:vacuolar-type H+-ATPase subunit E/Vma4